MLHGPIVIVSEFRVTPDSVLFTGQNDLLIAFIMVDNTDHIQRSSVQEICLNVF